MRFCKAHAVCTELDSDARGATQRLLAPKEPRDVSNVCTDCMARRIGYVKAPQRERKSPETHR